MKRRFLSLIILNLICLYSVLPLVVALETKYMHFRTITIDGKDTDWGGVESHLFVTEFREQRGTLIEINGTTFLPGNVSLQEGDSLIWLNNDTATQGNSKKHQISFNEEAPITWSSEAIDYGESTYIIVEDKDSYSYHTSRVNFAGYPDGNLSISEREWQDFSYGVMFANTPDKLFLGLIIENMSDNDNDDLYLKEIAVIFDDYADGSLEGENAFLIEREGDDYEATDMYFDDNELKKDKETNDITMAYTHEMPETDDKDNYLGDFFFEIAIPIDTTDMKDLGSTVGMQLGVEIILRVSNEEQDRAASLAGVADYYIGGGYPIISTHEIEEIYKLDLDPDKFVIVDLEGETLEDIFLAILEEIWIWVLSTAATVSAFILGAMIIRKKKRKKEDLPVTFF